MTGRLADINARIEGIGQLGAVVNAMRGIAAARVQQARNQIAAVDVYAATIAAAIGRALTLDETGQPAGTRRSARPACVLFCAEQGFAGAFSERVLAAGAADLSTCELFLIGTRGAGIAAERGLIANWHSAMPSHSPGIPKLADRIAEALYARIADGDIDRLVVVHSRWLPGRAIEVARTRLFPLDTRTLARAADANPPLTNLPPATLFAELTAEYMHAQLCHAALHSFAAENQARMQSMAAARHQIEQQLAALKSAQRQLRQEEITAEIIELAAGETASRARGVGLRGGRPGGFAPWTPQLS